MEEKFYTINQVAETLDMHHKTIRKFITEGKLRAGKVGKQWRISDYDLSSFMENNNFKLDNKRDEDKKIDYFINEASSNIEEQRINVSTVIDINEIDKVQYMRISNTLIALMNCKDSEMHNSTINMKYDEKDNRLKVLLWGQVKFTEEMLNTISLLVKETNLKR